MVGGQGAQYPDPVTFVYEPAGQGTGALFIRSGPKNPAGTGAQLYPSTELLPYPHALHDVRAVPFQ